MTDEEVLAAAGTVAKRAYAPYSGFRVGAALQTADSRVFTGCNVENASYGLSMCAERNAVAALVAGSSGGPATIAVIAVASPDAEPCFPCGACRQVLYEFGCPAVVVEVDGAPQAVPLATLLPHPFGPNELHR